MTAPAADDEARRIFGCRLPLAEEYAQRLVTEGVAHGHLGPREGERIWSRHLGNSAVVTDLLPADATVVDVGSGAGLPGLPMAIRRPDLCVVLLEPMARRAAFLESVAASLGLTKQVRVLRGRAEEPAVVATLGGADWLVARAVAPLDRLAEWCVPLLAPGGSLLAVKGSSAADEVRRVTRAAARLGVAEVQTRVVGTGPATARVVVVRRADPRCTGAGSVR